MIDGAEEYRAEPGSDLIETLVVRRTSFSSTVIGDRGRNLDVFMLKIASRWQSVNQWKSTTTATSLEDSGSTEQLDRIFMNKRRSNALHDSSLAYRLNCIVEYIQYQPYC